MRRFQAKLMISKRRLAVRKGIKISAKINSKLCLKRPNLQRTNVKRIFECITRIDNPVFLVLPRSRS